MATRNLLYLRTIPTSLTELQAAITQGILFSSSSITSIKHLDIAITLPTSFGVNISRRHTFHQVSNIINRVYTLTEGINDDIDVTVIILHEDYNACGGVIRHWSDLRRLNEVGRWSNILWVEDADDLFGPNCKNVIPLQIEHESVNERWWENHSHAMETLAEREEHKVSCVGGTFDYLHAGHKLLLTMTAYMIPSGATSPKIIVGLTGAELLKNKKHKEYVTSWETRCEATISFLRGVVGDTRPVAFHSKEDTEIELESDLPTSSRIKPFELSSPVGGDPITVEMHEIQDAFGPTITMEEVSCLVVSEETKGGGKLINDKRQDLGWSELEVFTVGLVGGDGTVATKLSSTELRRRRAEKADVLKGFGS
ncbi:hypothetical protein TWF225_002227 [Orbilia oligospora]|uniref:Cytidyltransferase-like domain-containing protein n=1 Tax=Orbilia oligospora TaxID=2813651 RepID=A0A7C8PHG7_ORBOL|nr:hypothetical protein TWF751_005673 [Orbilia oligospora]KAF3190473.1 hypothetical protein TWF225_002227 [Orbilia oligospora]KAF3234473.1 hypothetical protein TWF217_003601 [Orbilia oligospora]KAF3257909.1 hypothetical protein TWF128_004821 [Orbilia oligospora]KAF3289228.1 hypothetical protein TWF132_007668 [Orbilia oligospora]